MEPLPARVNKAWQDFLEEKARSFRKHERTGRTLGEEIFNEKMTESGTDLKGSRKLGI